MLKEDKHILEESLYAINHIFEYTQGIDSLEDLISDSKTYDAVLMNFIILGEASMKLSDELKRKLVDTDWRAIKGFRNFVAHDYFGIDTTIVWSAIKFYLPQLKTDFEKLLKE
jgi:uncharacterized protein with HEPN domain